MLAGNDRPLSGEEQQFDTLRREAGLFGIERPAHGLEHNSFLPEQIGDEAGAVVIVDAEDL